MCKFNFYTKSIKIRQVTMFILFNYLYNLLFNNTLNFLNKFKGLFDDTQWNKCCVFEEVQFGKPANIKYWKVWR